MKLGLREAKTTASQAVLAAAISEPDSTKSMKSLEFLMEFSMGSPQKKAMELMLFRTMEDKDPESVFSIIKTIVTSRTGVEVHVDTQLTSSKGSEIRGDMIMFAGDPDVKQKAIQQLFAIIDSDVKSEKAVKCLNLIYENSYEETRDEADLPIARTSSSSPQNDENHPRTRTIPLSEKRSLNQTGNVSLR